MRLYYAWRFHAIHRNSRAGDRKEGHDIAEQEKKFRADAASLARQIEEAERAPARVAAIARQASANAEMDSAQAAYLSMVRRDWADPKKTVSAAQRFRRAKEAKALADKQFADADDERMRLVARQATLPGSGLAQKLDLYDRNLLLDVEAIKSRRKRFSKAVLRPHYRAMLEAYEAEFDLGKGLLAEHEEALAFFDHYIHDSLAGFAKDATLPSDPRVIYVGGDVRSEYARVEDEPSLTNNAPKQFA